MARAESASASAHSDSIKGLAQAVAEVEEMLLAGAALGEFGLFPLGDEFLGSWRGLVMS